MFDSGWIYQTNHVFTNCYCSTAAVALISVCLRYICFICRPIHIFAQYLNTFTDEYTCSLYLFEPLPQNFYLCNSRHYLSQTSLTTKAIIVASNRMHPSTLYLLYKNEHYICCLHLYFLTNLQVSKYILYLFRQNNTYILQEMAGMVLDRCPDHTLWFAMLVW